MDGATTGTNLENTILSKKKASHRNPPVACFIDVKCPEWQIHWQPRKQSVWLSRAEGNDGLLGSLLCAIILLSYFF